jgi:uncharacterized protein (TIGR00369 family)
VDGLAFITTLVGASPMPMAEHFDFELVGAAKGEVRARATPAAHHENPFGVAQGGFAGTVLDMALGLVSISVLSGSATGVATTDLSVRYMRPINAATGTLDIRAEVLHVGKTIVVSEARLLDGEGRLYACAQSTSLISHRRT